MPKYKIFLALGALTLTMIVLAGCGGIPGNSVAQVDGSDITKAQLNTMLLAATKSKDAPKGVALQPPKFDDCVAQKRKLLPKSAKTTNKDLSSQCKAQFESLVQQTLPILIQIKWVQGEADERGIKVSSKDKNTAEKQFKLQQGITNNAAFKAFLKKQGWSTDFYNGLISAIAAQNKIVEQIKKGAATEAKIKEYYAKNKSKFVTPARRELLLVQTSAKGKAKAEQALKALKSGQSFSSVAKKYSIEPNSKAQGGKAVYQKGFGLPIEKDVFAAKQGALIGPVKTPYGYYVFKVTKSVAPVQQKLSQVKSQIETFLAREKLDAFAKNLNSKWLKKTTCRTGYVVAQVCSNGKEATKPPAQSETGTPNGQPQQGQPTQPSQPAQPTQ